ncbi:hypothetical protein QL285_012854 [Trifolium repens]|nr:hypothetical protein QL285_012854 [Trifolium repens]
MAKKQRVDQQTPNLRLVGSWSDAVTELDYIKYPPSGCGMTSSDFVPVLNPQVAHYLDILKKWKDNEASGIGYRVYTDEEENAAAVNYLKNRSTAREEPFTEVVSKAKKKKGISVHNIRSSDR